MKTFCMTLVLLVCYIAGSSQQRIFLRLFGSNGSKIARGQLLGTTDSSVILANDKDSQEIKYTAISFIKTKRSFGHTMLVTGALTTTIIFCFTLIAMNGASGEGIHIDPPPGYLFAASLVPGIVVGTTAGALQRRDNFRVNGHYKEWQEVKAKLDKILGQEKKITTYQ